jgi:branched-chain amino acid transport system ATP-binding protein
MLRIENLSKAGVQNINKKFGGVVAISDCSFKIKRGEIVGIIGPNGSGKTTLFNIINGIIKSDSGKIFIDDIDITHKSTEKIANLGITRSFQNAQLFDNLSVEDNLLLLLYEDDTNFFKSVFTKDKHLLKNKKRVEELLSFIDFNDLKNVLAKDLSWGQKKLIDFLRSIARVNKLLLLDEPASGIIPVYRQEKLAKIMKEIKKENGTVLLIDHDMDFLLDVVDRVIVLDKGRVIAKGTPEQIKNDKNVLEAYLGE